MPDGSSARGGALGFALPPSRRVRRRPGVPAARRRRARARRARCSSASSPRRASSCSAGATCRPTTATLGADARSRSSRSSSSCSSAAAPAARGADRRDALRAQAVRDPQARSSTRSTRWRSPSAQQSFYVVSLSCRHADLQGHADGRPDRADLPRPGRPRRRVGARAGAPALQHQHVPVLAAGAPVPLRRAQRRDQHAARQHQLDARARGAARVGRCSATTCRSCCRSSAKAAATRRRSTTCSSSWS